MTILAGERIEHQYSKPGIYQVRLTVTDNVGAESTDYAMITVNAPPIADFYPIKRVAPGQIIQFDGTCSRDPDGEIRHAWWEFGDNTPVQTGLSAEHSFKDPGRYAVTLTVQDDSEASENTASKTETIEVNYPPLANVGDDIHTCNQKVSFDASKSIDPDGDVLTYSWEFGDGTRGQGRSIEHTYSSPGIYPVSLTIDDGHGLSNSMSSAKMAAYVNAPPRAVIEVNSQTVCAGELVLFDAGKSEDPEKGLLRYIWDLGEGEPQEGINPVRSYKTGGDYRIRLKVMDDTELACNSAEAETIIHVIDAPIADAGEDQTVCANTLVQFDGSRSMGGGRRIKSYEWDFGDGQYGVGVNPVHVYSHEGEYNARLVITVSGEGECANVSEDEVTIRVMAAPIARFNAKEAGCAGERLLFDASDSQVSNGNITEFAWGFGDGTSDSGEKVDHTYEAPGQYAVTLRLTADSEGSCNVAEYSETITINSRPSSVIQVTSSDKATFSGQIYVTDVKTLLRFNGAGSDDSDGYIRSYTWNFGDGSQEYGPFVSHQYEQPGEYPVTLAIQDNSETLCNTNTSTLIVRVREPKLQEITGPTVVCRGQTVEYTLVSEGPVEWICNDGTTDTGNQIRKTFHIPGTYQIQAKVGEDWMPTREITVLELPEVTLPARIEVYPGDTIEIQPVYNRSSGLPLLFRWDMDDGTIFTTEDISHIYRQPGEYTPELSVTLKDGPECLKALYRIPVNVYAPPEVVILVEPDKMFAGGARDTVMFEAVTTNDQSNWNYHWDFGDGQQTIGRRVNHTYKQSGIFQVTVTLSDALQRTSQSYTFSQQITVEQRK